MTLEQASIILSLSDLQRETLFDLIKEDRENARRAMEDPGSSHDMDQYFKGGINFANQVMEYWPRAFQTLNPKKEEEDEK